MTSASKTKSSEHLNEAILSLADQLLVNNKLKKKDTGTIALTSFVDLDKFEKTSKFGRIVSESLFSELFARGFNVTDFRGQSSLTVNKTGEFYITRSISKLRKEIPNSYVLVGTYSKIDEEIFINARILDNITGKVLTSGRTIYENEDCRVFSLCKKTNRKIRIIAEEPRDNHNKIDKAPMQVAMIL
jgi:TolB-like protein